MRDTFLLPLARQLNVFVWSFRITLPSIVFRFGVDFLSMGVKSKYKVKDLSLLSNLMSLKTRAESDSSSKSRSE